VGFFSSRGFLGGKPRQLSASGCPSLLTYFFLFPYEFFLLIFGASGGLVLYTILHFSLLSGADRWTSPNCTPVPEWMIFSFFWFFFPPPWCGLTLVAVCRCRACKLHEVFPSVLPHFRFFLVEITTYPSGAYAARLSLLLLGNRFLAPSRPFRTPSDDPSTGRASQPRRSPPPIGAFLPACFSPQSSLSRSFS